MFKEGDKVKIKGRCTDCVAGEIATVHSGTKVGGKIGTLFAWGEGKRANCCCQGNWELVPEAKSPEPYEFKEGDTVEICRVCSPHNVKGGETYVLEPNPDFTKNNPQCPSDGTFLYSKLRAGKCACKCNWRLVPRRGTWETPTFPIDPTQPNVYKGQIKVKITKNLETLSHVGSVSPVTKTTMSKITRFVKNLTLSKREKLFREQELKDECGNYLGGYTNLIMFLLCQDMEERVEEHVKKMLKEEETNKKK